MGRNPVSPVSSDLHSAGNGAAQSETLAVGEAHAGVMLVDVDRGIVAANHFACVLLGRTRDELVGHRPDELVAWPRLVDGAPPAEAGLARFLRAEGSTVTVRYEARDVPLGTVRLVLWLLYPRLETPPSMRLGAAVRSELLSPRELEILQLMADGCDNEEISHRLVISKETVKSHVRRLLRKMNARSRTHAVAIAFRRSLVD